MGAKAKPQMKNARARVLLVDDHPIVRQGLAQLVNHERDLVVCGEAGDAAAALAAVEALRPDVVIVDISLKGHDGIELIKQIRIRWPTLPTVALSMYDESLYAERVLQAGGHGYVMKQEATENVIAAIRRVLAGEVYLSPTMQTRILRRAVAGKIERTPIETLSDRELQVLRLIGGGRGTRDIAETLQLSIKTIESYREHIKRKLSLQRATDLVRYAVHWATGSAGAESSSQPKA